MWVIRALLYNLRFKKVGKLSYIGKPLLVNGKNIILGQKVRILPGMRIETHGDGKIEIADNTSIGNHLHIVSGESVKIGKNTTISSSVMITDLNHDYTEIDVHIMNQKHILNPVTIGDNCFIGSGAKILPGTILGKQCIVGANAVVSGIFLDYCVIAGTPAKVIKKYNHETKRWEQKNG
ncbi:MAG: DapH/DapD/GlmU-related protein [Culicoidibacterales bacterium]